MKGIFFYRLCLFCSLFLGVGCNRQSTDSLYEISLEEGIKAARRLKLADYADSIKYIALETTDSCLIGDIYKIERWRHLYYIRDLNENLYVFDENGRFLRQIGKKGRGPEEYGFLADFAVDPANGDIYLVDYGKMLIYTKEGKWKRSVPVDPAWQVCTFDSLRNLIFIAPLSPHRKGNEPFYLLTVCDRVGRVIYRLQGETVKVGVGLFNWIHEQSGKVFYKEELSDTLFYLNAELDARPYACVNFGEYKFTSALLRMEMADKWPSCIRLTGVYDFQKSVVLNVQKGLMEQEPDAYLFDKHSGEVGKLGKWTGDNGFLMEGIGCRPLTAEGKELICVISAACFADNDKISEGPLKKVAVNIKEDSNPVLAIFYMK